MSAEVVGLLWRTATLPLAEKALLLAMADAVDDRGRGVLPECVAALAAKVSLSVRQVQRHLRFLEATHWIRAIAPAGYRRPVTYQINVGKLRASATQPQDETPWPEMDGRRVTLVDDMDVTHAAEKGDMGVTHQREKGDTDVTHQPPAATGRAAKVWSVSSLIHGNSRNYRKQQKSPETSEATPGSRRTTQETAKPGENTATGSQNEPAAVVVAAPSGAKLAWEGYRAAYVERYSVEPVRNKRVNALLARFAERIPAHECGAVAAFYVQHRGVLYVRAGHDVTLLLRDAEKLRMECVTQRQITDADARQQDGSMGQAEITRRLIAKADREEAERRGYHARSADRSGDRDRRGDDRDPAQRARPGGHGAQPLALATRAGADGRPPGDGRGQARPVGPERDPGAAGGRPPVAGGRLGHGGGAR